MRINDITVTATGANITTGAASAAVTIPNTSAGTPPVYIRVTSTAAAHVRFGAIALATDLMITPNGDGTILRVPRGATQFAAIQDTATGTVNIAPLEDA